MFSDNIARLSHFRRLKSRRHIFSYVSTGENGVAGALAFTFQTDKAAGPDYKPIRFRPRPFSFARAERRVE